MFKLMRAIKKSIRREDIEFINLIVFIFSFILIVFAKLLSINTIMIIGIILGIPSILFCIGSSCYDLIIIIKENIMEIIERIKNNLS